MEKLRRSASSQPRVEFAETLRRRTEPGVWIINHDHALACVFAARYWQTGMSAPHCKKPCQSVALIATLTWGGARLRFATAALPQATMLRPLQGAVMKNDIR
jgi:hypothetical protein